MIEIENVYRKYGSFTAVNGVSLRFRNGFFYGLTGALGSGVSSLFQMIAGCLMPSSGAVTVSGYDTRFNGREVRRQIGYMPEHFSPCGQMTVREFLEFVADAKGIHAEAAIRQVNEVTAAAGLIDVRDTLMGSLPAVMQRRVGVAQTLLGNPDTLLFDAPLEGLDGQDADALLSLIVRLSAKKTVLLSDSDQTRLESVCARIIVMGGGTVLSETDVSDISSGKEADV